MSPPSEYPSQQPPPTAPAPPQSPQSPPSSQSLQPTNYATTTPTQQPLPQNVPAQPVYQLPTDQTQRYVPSFTVPPNAQQVTQQPAQMVHQHPGKPPQSPVQHYQAGAAPPQQYVHNTNASLAQQPAEINDKDDIGGQCGYFFLGFFLSFTIGGFAFLFFCCADAIGLTTKRRGPFLGGAIVGCISELVMFVIIVVVVSNNA